jgi:uroporphyrin-III C-methyltransferase/precorrin-2 dehydrogenase/sirohydrochlorin ferrochelatase
MASRRSQTEKARKKPEDRLDVFPAFMKVAGRRVVVVGHGGEAAAKVRLLGETNSDIVVIGQGIDHELQSAVDQFSATHIAENFKPKHLTDAAMVFSAREDWDLDKAVIDAARIMGVPVNAVDKPELCDFYTGALVNRAPIAVAITSTGVGPVLARHIRARIEGMLPRRPARLRALPKASAMRLRK